MSGAPPELSRLQAWMQHALSQPHGIPADGAEVAEQIAPSRRQTPAERLAIYHRAYFARLIDCLRTMFPAVAEAAGDEGFAELAVAYLERHPPQSYTLNRLADRLVDFLRATRPPREADQSPDWADFLAELALLEHAIEQVFDGAGHEGEPPWDASELASLGGEEAGTARLRLSPSVRMLKFAFPVNAYYSAFRAGQSPPLPSPARSWLLLYREDYVVRRQELTEGQYALLAALLKGRSLGTALAEAADAAPEEATPTAIHQWFRQWVAIGIVRGVFPQSVGDDGSIQRLPG